MICCFQYGFLFGQLVDAGLQVFDGEVRLLIDCIVRGMFEKFIHRINSQIGYGLGSGCYAEPRVGESIEVKKESDKLVKVDQMKMNYRTFNKSQYT